MNPTVFPFKRPSRRLVKILGILCLSLLATGIAFYWYRSFKIRQVEKQSELFVSWLAGTVAKQDQIRLVDAFGRKEPDWWGITNLHLVFITPSKKEITISCLIESTAFDTRIIKVDVYYLGLNPKQLSLEELAAAFEKPPGQRLEIPVDAVYSNSPIDLPALVPDAFK